MCPCCERTAVICTHMLATMHIASVCVDSCEYVCTFSESTHVTHVRLEYLCIHMAGVYYSHVKPIDTWMIRDLSHISDMGWLRLVGSLKLQVSSAEYSLFYRALLQKRRIISRSLLSVATPY